MGMSTHVVGFKPPDEKWEKMKKVWDACIEADMEIPDEVIDFFEGEEPDPAGVEVDLEALICVTNWQNTDHGRAGFEIHIDKLPKDIKIVRVYNSW